MNKEIKELEKELESLKSLKEIEGNFKDLEMGILQTKTELLEKKLEIANSILKKLEMEPLRNHFTREYSGGHKVYVKFGQVLSKEDVELIKELVYNEN